jgi:hypothetical protein
MPNFKQTRKRAKSPDRSLGRVRPKEPSQAPHISFDPETEVKQRNILSHGTSPDRHYFDGTTARGRINSMIPEPQWERNAFKSNVKTVHPHRNAIFKKNAADERRARERCEEQKKSCTGKFCDMMTCGLTKKYTWGGKKHRKSKRKKSRKSKRKKSRKSKRKKRRKSKKRRRKTRRRKQSGGFLKPYWSGDRVRGL